MCEGLEADTRRIACCSPVAQQIPCGVLIKEVVENKEDQNSHPEGDNQVARSDEHDRKEEQRAKHNVLEERLLSRSD